MGWCYGSDDNAARYPTRNAELRNRNLGKGYAGVVIVDLAEGNKAYMRADFALFYSHARR